MTAIGTLIGYGLVVGVSLGLTGGGGSIITVPLLVYLVGQPVHVAIPTSLVIVGGTALTGYASRLTIADTRAGIIVGLLGILGAIPGRYLALLFSGRTLLLLFACIMLVASVFMFRSKTYEARESGNVRWWAVTLAGIGIGFLTGFLGVGGGFIIVPTLVLVLGMGMRQAIPTSLLVIAINCASSLLAQGFAAGRVSREATSINWWVALIFLVGGLVGSWAGGAVAGRLNQRALKRIFAVFIFAVALFVAASTTGLIPISVK